MALAVALTPSLLTAAYRVLAPAGKPATVEAATHEHYEAYAPTPTPSLSPSEQALAAVYREHADQAITRGPLRAPPQPALAAPTPEPAQPTPHAAPVPSFALTSIMSTRNGPRAVINGRMRSIGDAAAAGWIIEAIDPDTGEAILAEQSGERRRISVRLRQPN